MMRVRTLLLTALLATTSPGCSNRSEPSSSPRPTPKTAAPSWQEFSHAQGKFSVLIPGTPQEIVQDVPTAMGNLKQTLDVVELRDQAKAFMVSFADYPAKAPYGDDAYAHKRIDEIIAGIASSRKGTHATGSFSSTRMTWRHSWTTE